MYCISDVPSLRLSCCINAFIFCVHYLCLVGWVYVFYVGHVDKSSLYETLFHCNILSKHHNQQIIDFLFILEMPFILSYHKYVHIQYIYIYIYLCIYVYISIYIYVNMYICIYTYNVYNVYVDMSYHKYIYNCK
jgi:hypothetical protein